jgi:hypothetical protein
MYIINDNDLTWQATGMILIELDYLKMAEHLRHSSPLLSQNTADRRRLADHFMNIYTYIYIHIHI